MDFRAQIVVIVLVLIVGLLGGAWIRSWFIPPPETPGMTQHQIDSIRISQQRSQFVIDSLEAERNLAQKRTSLLQNQINILMRQYEQSLKNVPEHPIDPDLSKYTFEQKADLFNDLTKKQ